MRLVLLLALVGVAVLVFIVWLVLSSQPAWTGHPGY